MRRLQLAPLLALVLLPVGCGDDASQAADAPTQPDGADAAAFDAPPDAPAPDAFLPDAPPTAQRPVDLLLVVDNSRGAGDKQALFADAASALVARLTNPPCVDSLGTPAATQPASGLEACPVAGTTRAFLPVNDLHLGVISSSLGGHGADACQASDSYSCAPGVNTSTNDRGHLLSRVGPCSSETVPTYQSLGFLAWDALGALTPPGEQDLNAGLLPSLQAMILGAGELGCGYEATQEAWYRFLVDPAPYEQIAVDPGTSQATPTGTDTTLLAQRAAFLRPHSVLVIAVVSDEDDCSIKEYGQYYLAAQLRDPSNTRAFHLPRPRSECATNPNDPCCRSCGQDQSGCPTDPNCDDGMLGALEDDISVRCFDQKRRFGIDFLYPVERYTSALTQPMVTNSAGELVPNPLFTEQQQRSPEDVFLVGIVGVPWQDLANDPGDATSGPKDSAALAWDAILGDPAAYVPPGDPHMHASIDPRVGTNPITGTAMAPPGSPAGTDPINGHERTFPNRDGLQYAATYTLPTPQDCMDVNLVACDCQDPDNDSPVCASHPMTGMPQLQVGDGAVPGLRHLAILRSLGSRGIVASIVPAQATDPATPAYGYRPSIDAIVRQLRPALWP